METRFDVITPQITTTVYLVSGFGVPWCHAVLLPGLRPKGGDEMHKGGVRRHRRRRHRHPGREVQARHEDAVGALVRPVRTARGLSGEEDVPGREAPAGAVKLAR